MGDRLLGGLEQLVLLAILHIEEEDAYAVRLRELLDERLGRPVSRGALYTVLERLEKKGFVESKMGEPTAQRGGRAKRFYRVSAHGVTVLRHTRDMLSEMWKGLDGALGESR